MGTEHFDGLEMDEWRNQSLPRSRERAAGSEGQAVTTDNTVSPAFYAMAFTGRGATEPFFCGHRLATLRREHNLTPEQQARNLGLTLNQLAYLALCRMPRPGEREALVMIAEGTGMTAGALAELLGVG